MTYGTNKPVSVAARSQVWSAAARLLGWRVRVPSGGMSVCRECCILSGRGLCDGGHLSRGALPVVMVKPRQCGGPGPLVAVVPLQNERNKHQLIKFGKMMSAVRQEVSFLKEATNIMDSRCSRGL